MKIYQKLMNLEENLSERERVKRALYKISLSLFIRRASTSDQSNPRHCKSVKFSKYLRKMTPKDRNFIFHQYFAIRGGNAICSRLSKILRKFGVSDCSWTSKM